MRPRRRSRARRLFPHCLPLRPRPAGRRTQRRGRARRIRRSGADGPSSRTDTARRVRTSRNMRPACGIDDPACMRSKDQKGEEDPGWDPGKSPLFHRRRAGETRPVALWEACTSLHRHCLPHRRCWLPGCRRRPRNQPSAPALHPGHRCPSPTLHWRRHPPRHHRRRRPFRRRPDPNRKRSEGSRTPPSPEQFAA